MTPLPIDPLIPQALHSLASSPCLVIEAPPGAGKTTRIPPALLRFGGVLVLEPRRLAARMAARRVAAEMGEKPGETVGYQVRFEEVAGPHTRLRFLTEGVLNRRLLADPELRGVHSVVLDEFHERHPEGDVALALLDRLRRTARSDLRLIVMSATLDGAAVSEYLGGCPVLRSEGRLHPVAIEYRPHSSDPLESRVASALEALFRDGVDGDVLVFLPGASEIRRAQRACSEIAARSRHDLVPLHGDLSPGEQDRAVLPGARPKIILSTNVAESSLTIEGITAVVDSGLARVARDSPWTGLPSLEVARISRASAGQRAGLAGRLRPGRVIRLYPQEDFLRRPARDTPEILRRELSGLLLDLRAMSLLPAALRWFDPPPEASWSAAAALLDRLGASPDLARFPVHPRLAVMIGEAQRRGVPSLGCRAAAVLSAGGRLPPGKAAHRGPSDVLALLDTDPPPQSRRLYDQLRRVARGPDTAGDDALLLAILRAFSDRVARRRGNNEVLLASGGAAALSESSVVDRDWMVAIDLEDRREGRPPLVRLASGIRPEWLLDLFPERITERAAVEWSREAERVEAVSSLLYDGIAIEESRGGRPDPEAAARLLASKALEAGIEYFDGGGELDAFLSRVSFASAHGQVPALTVAHIGEALEAMCAGLRSFAELRAAASGGGLVRALEARLHPRERRLLEELAPSQIRLGRGRQTVVHYAAGKPPWVASRLQDFFGMRESPRVAAGKVPLVLHLLAPNRRPVQTTTDLAGFWQRLYPQIRRELSRRYPKHSWPEDPLA